MVLKRVLLTGASGMLGFHFIREFKKNNIEFVCSSRKVPKFLGKINWFAWDLKYSEKINSLKSKIGAVDAIFHAGGYVPNSKIVNKAKIIDTNVRSAVKISELAIEYNIPVCFISGSTVYDDTKKGKILEGDKLSVNGPGGFYGFSKLLTENIFKHFIKQGLNLLIIRPSSIYGFGQHKSKLIPKLIDMAMKKKCITLYGPFNYKTNFVHASDVAKASTLIMEKRGRLYEQKLRRLQDRYFYFEN